MTRGERDIVAGNQMGHMPPERQLVEDGAILSSSCLQGGITSMASCGCGTHR